MSAFIIFDTEFTAWPGSQVHTWSREGEAREIIQLAALKTEITNGQLAALASLNVLVQPTINPVLSDYIQNLTGIKQALVDDHGVDFVSCAEQFYEFADDGTLPCYSWGPDVGVLQENFTINSLPWPYSSEHFLDLKRVLMRVGLDYRQYVSGDLAKCVGQPQKGHMHNALYDVKSILVFLQTLLADNRLNLTALTRGRKWISF